MLSEVLVIRSTCSSCFCRDLGLVDVLVEVQETRAIKTSSAWVLAKAWPVPHDDTGMHDCSFSVNFFEGSMFNA